VEPQWAWTFTLGADLLLLLLASAWILSPPSPRYALLSNRLYRISLLFLALFVVFVTLQLLPLPRTWLAALSPEADRLHLLEGNAPISLHAEATGSTLVRFLSSFALFFAPFVLFHRGKRFRSVMGFLAGLGGVLAAYALLNSLSGGEISLHFGSGARGSRAREPFVNPNHLATYLGLLLPVPLAVLFFQKPKARPKEREPFLARFNEFFTDLSKRYWKILAGLAFAFIALAVLLTLSRAGILAAGLGLVAFFSCFAALRRKRVGLGSARMLGTTFLILIVATTALWIGLGPLVDRYASTDLGMADRLRVWSHSLSLWERFPLFGTGFGTFTDAFPLVQPPSIPQHFTFPHNEYVGLLVECGLLGASLLAASVVFAAAGFLRDLARFSVRRTRTLAIAWTAAVAMVLLFHAVFDFTAHIPAVGFLSCFALGTGFAALRKPLPSQKRKRRGRFPDKARTAKIGPEGEEAPVNADAAPSAKSQIPNSKS